MSEELPQSGNGAMYGFIGLALVLGAVGLYCSSVEEETPPEITEPTPPPTPPRANQFEPEIELPPEDSGVDTGVDTGAVEEPATMMSGMRRTPRECTGNIDPSAVQSVIRRQQQQVRSCYERRLKQNNLLQGRVVVGLTIGSDGRPSTVSVRGSLRDNEVFGCVRRLAQAWQFPRPTGGSCARFNAPFTLTPRP